MVLFRYVSQVFARSLKSSAAILSLAGVDFVEMRVQNYATDGGVVATLKLLSDVVRKGLVLVSVL